MSTELSAEQQAVNDEALQHRAALAAYAFSWLKDWSAANSHVDQARAAMLKKWDAPPDLKFKNLRTGNDSAHLQYRP